MSSISQRSSELPRIIHPKRHVDERGWFSESFHRARLHELGIDCDFVQDNLSSSRRTGTLRGLHFQGPPSAQAKLVSVMRGRILDVIVDVRRGSPTYGKHVSGELSAESGLQLYIPVGFAHGYLTLEDDVLVMYKVSAYYAPASEAGIRWNDADVAFPWPIKDADIIISQKDRELPLLRDLVSPFSYAGDPLQLLPTADRG